MFPCERESEWVIEKDGGERGRARREREREERVKYKEGERKGTTENN